MRQVIPTKQNMYAAETYALKLSALRETYMVYVYIYKNAKKKLVHIPLREGRTIHHDVKAKDGSGKIVLRAASKGTGIIAGGPVRAVCEVLGVKDIVAKSIGSSNPHNMIKATFSALGHIQAPRAVAQKRGKRLADVLSKREDNQAGDEAAASN